MGHCVLPCMLYHPHYHNQSQGAFVPTDYTKRVAQAIMTKLGGSGKYCALHVRRGDKLPQVEGLDEATQPAAIYEKIKGRCPPGKVLYLATNEKDPHFFDDLKKHWKVFTYRYVRGKNKHTHTDAVIFVL